MLHEYLMKYVDYFDENFPIYAFMGISDNEIIKTIKSCLDKGEPYILDEQKDTLY